MRAPTTMYEPGETPTIPPGMTSSEWRRERSAVSRDREMRWRQMIARSKEPPQ